MHRLETLQDYDGIPPTRTAPQGHLRLVVDNTLREGGEMQEHAAGDEALDAEIERVLNMSPTPQSVQFIMNTVRIR